MKVNKKLKLLVVFICLFSFVKVYATENVIATQEPLISYTNESNGYKVLIEDNENLLTEEEEKLLSEDMKPLTDYGNIAFASASCTNVTELCARDIYNSKFGDDNGTLFLIDMADRMIYIYSKGHNYDVVTGYKARVITDNVYLYATRGDYYGCAKEGFRQVQKLLAGEKIAAPMRYITNGLLSLFLGFLICFAFIASASKMNKNTRRKKNNYVKSLAIANFAAVVTGTHKVYNPPSDSGSGFSSGGSFGGGGFSGGGGGFSGGGGSSGGGGGHHF